MADCILGIDLGTTNSLVGVVDAGFPILLADKEGARSTPSAIYVNATGETTVGLTALHQRGLEPKRVITSVKRLIGRRAGEQQWEPAYDLRALGLSAVVASACILKHLRGVAERAMDCPIQRAVITVPAFFNDAQRAATKRAGELAGLQVERILAEPTAAALAYGLDKLDEQKKIAVYDLGGGTFDVSVLEMRDGVFQVLATAGDTQLGGDDIDLALARLIWERSELVRLLWWEQLPRASQVRLITAAEEAKKRLSSAASTTVELPFFLDGQSLSVPLHEADLRKAAAPCVERSLQHCRRALLDAGLTVKDLDEVLLVGGSTRLHCVRQAVAELFEREPNTSQNPDEAIAKGAVIQAGILSGALRQVVLLDVTPLSLGIETFGGLMNVILPRNSTLPCKAGEMFTNAVANQQTMLIRVLQGERELAKDNWELGRVEVPFPPGAKGSARVGVQFSLDRNGILQVLARDTATQTDTVLEIQNTAIDVDDTKVEEMIASSVEHAFADVNERIWTEAALKAQELLPAVDEALSQMHGFLPEAEVESIRAAAKRVQTLLNGKEHDARALKAATAALDDATQSLAVMLMDAAMEEALERKLAAG
jgi:molecular chaperone DnaK